MSSVIRIMGDIDNEAYARFDRILSRIEVESPGTEIQIDLMSDGGSAYSALAFADRIGRSALYIKIRATGLVASAATLILACGDKRTMTPNAWVMVHEDEASVEGGRTSSVEAAAAHARRLENQWNALMAHYTKLTASEWSTLDKAETYLTPAQCLEYGLVDEVI